jgi:phosphonate transport system permease protein
LAAPFGFLAARNVIPNIFVHFALCRGLDVTRAVDVLICVLIWINVVGLGPFAGILAIATSDFGSLGKLFSEAIETADNRAVEGILSAGGGPFHAVHFGIVPQVMPLFISQNIVFFRIQYTIIDHYRNRRRRRDRPALFGTDHGGGMAACRLSDLACSCHGRCH